MLDQAYSWVLNSFFIRFKQSSPFYNGVITCPLNIVEVRMNHFYLHKGYLDVLLM